MSTTHSARQLADIAPITGAEATTLAQTAYARVVDQLEVVSPEQWSASTDCTGWTVRHLAGHLLGAMRAAASLRELASQQGQVLRRVRREGVNPVDAMTQIQIERTATLSPDELVAEARSLVRAAAIGRRRPPGPLRRIRLKVDLGYAVERWPLAYLNDVILTRDTWLHRIDLHRALGSAPLLSAGHDGRIVEEVAAEWARRHAQPCSVTLTGPAGGTYVSGDGGPELSLDAVEFCRIVSGRAPGVGLLATPVPF